MVNHFQIKRDFSIRVQILMIVCLGGAMPRPGIAQRAAWQDDAFSFRCHVAMPSSTKKPEVVVCELFSHGAVTDKQPAIAVYRLNRQVSSRVLQRGPGDLCRIAFQTVTGTQDYQVYYGATDASEPIPEWTADAGLLLETRRWQPCNLRDVGSLKQAFASAPSIGSDFVTGVFHRYNPFATKPASMLSHYQGKLHITRPGAYQFFTSSQDCSFLQIDSKTVVALPGRQLRPVGRARFKGTVNLQPGIHQFDYWHAATTAATCAVAAWQPPGAPRPVVIPAEAFQSNLVRHVASTRPEQNHEGPLPDFRCAVMGEAPLDHDDHWAVRAQFSSGPERGTPSGRCSWQFGDGQTSDQWHATHIFLHPGLFIVTLDVHQRGKSRSVTNRVWIGRVIQQRGKQTADKLDDYLSLIADYDPSTLDAQSRLCLVQMYIDREDWQATITAAAAALAGEHAAADDRLMWELAGLAGPVARIRRQDPNAALQLWKSAGKQLVDTTLRCRCALEAADLLLNELQQPDAALPMLEYAKRGLGTTSGHVSSRMWQLWGDYYARHGDAEKARQAYRAAVEKLGTVGVATRRNAQRGALSRSTDAFLRDKDLQRAWATLEQWQRDYPRDKMEGYLSLLLARYWVARGLPEVAIAVAGDALTINPNSPYADRLVMLQAQTEQATGNRERAIAAYNALLTDYPGSPLINNVKHELEALQKTP